MNFLIVDDEPLAQKILVRYLNDIPNATIVGTCKTALEASEVLSSQQVDVMFLDINMPKMSGLDFLKTLKKAPEVIITTAYREYALEGFELDVVDYLKKPFSFERFFAALNKAKSRMTQHAQVQLPAESPCYIFVKEDKVTYKVNLDDVLFIESVGDYNKLYTKKKVYLTYQTLKKLLELLPPERFVRVHKSYIIALDKIDSIIGNQVTIGGEFVSIGQTYRKMFFDLIEKRL